MKAVLTVAHFIILVAFLFLIWRKELKQLRGYLLPAALLKIILGMGVGLLYLKYYHAGDTLQYFSDGRTIASFARTNLLDYLQFLWNGTEGLSTMHLYYAEPRALFFVKFVSFLNLLTGDNYWLMSAYMSFISFLGSWYFVRIINRHIPNMLPAALIAFCFFPSVIFWTSGLIKESVACGALFYLAGFFLSIWFMHSVTSWKCILALVAVWVLWGLKYYYAGIFIPVVGASLFYKIIVLPKIKIRIPFLEILAWLVIFIVPLAFLSIAHPNFYLSNFLEVIVANNEVYQEFSAPEDLISFNALKPDVVSIISNSPLALFSGLFRPHIFEGSNALQVVAAVENLLLLFFFVFALFRINRPLVSDQRILVVATLTYVIMLSVFITLSTPNFGTLSRYRAGYLPFFCLLVFSNNPLFHFLQRSWLRLVR
jgi:hypothetical protein